MNKYQEALEHIIKCDREDCGMSYLSDAYRNDLSVLRELVDKATPNKPIKDRPSKIRYVQTYVCPSCRNSFSGEISRFCYHCGQALDWSDERC